MEIDFYFSATILKATGLRNPSSSGSHYVKRGDFHRVFRSQTHCSYFADLRELACVIMRGTAVSVFLTPQQVRFFCAHKKGADKAINKTIPTNRG